MINGYENLYNNDSLLLKYQTDGRKVGLGFMDTIGAQRPLSSSEEASFAAHEVNNVLACIEYGLERSDSLPGDSEAVNEGLRIILESCRLVNLRVEQYLDHVVDKDDGKRRKVKKQVRVKLFFFKD